MRYIPLLLFVLFSVPGIAGPGTAGPGLANAHGLSVQRSATGSQNKGAPNNPAGPEQDLDLQLAEGELSKIDAQKQLLWIATADHKEIQFSYTTQTKVEGADDSVEGLSGMSGSHLKIHYKVIGGMNSAIRIEIVPVAA